MKNPRKIPLKQSGDFRSEECQKFLAKSDIVITNPPFSLFREYVAQLIEFDKKFVIIGSLNAMSYKNIFPLIRSNKIWLGYGSGDMQFCVPDYYEERTTRFWIDEVGQKWRSLGNCIWLTNLDIQKRHEDLETIASFYKNPTHYPKYDNYDAINVDKTSEIPLDYEGAMGVPITFLDKYNPEQFEILGMLYSAGYDKDFVGLEFKGIRDARAIVNGKTLYSRVIIRNKKLSSQGVK